MAQSPWSQRNVAIAERLSASGRCSVGRSRVRQAKADGRWNTAYAGQASMEVPEDLADALIGILVLRQCFRRSPVRIGTPSSIGSETQRSWRPEPDVSSSLSRCWPEARPSTRKVHDHLLTDRRRRMGAPDAAGTGDSHGRTRVCKVKAMKYRPDQPIENRGASHEHYDHHSVSCCRRPRGGAP